MNTLDTRKNNFDFLRFVAATIVTFYHSAPLSLGDSVPPLLGFDGSIGVGIFFIISGYLITQSFLNRPDLLFFLKSRLLRLVPALTVVVLITVFVLGPLITTESIISYFSQQLTIQYLQNVLPFNHIDRLPGVFVGNAYKGAVNGSLWTIPYELKCYIMVAILGIVGLLRLKFIAVLIFIIALFYPFQNPDLGEFLGYFSAGMLCYHFKEYLFEEKYSSIIAVMLLMVVMLSPKIFPLSVICWGFITIFIALNQNIEMGNFGKYGDFSYGIYIYSFPIQQLVTFYFGGAMNPYANFFISYPIALLFAILSWNLIEKPALSLKRKSLLDFITHDSLLPQKSK